MMKKKLMFRWRRGVLELLIIYVVIRAIFRHLFINIISVISYFTKWEQQFMKFYSNVKTLILFGIMTYPQPWIVWKL
jgi:hypothetical protein